MSSGSSNSPNDSAALRAIPGADLVLRNVPIDVPSDMSLIIC